MLHRAQVMLVQAVQEEINRHNLSNVRGKTVATSHPSSTTEANVVPLVNCHACSIASLV